MEAHNQTAAGRARELVEKRSQRRFKLEVDIRITSRTSGLLSGYTVDISESGISAMLRIEVQLGELVQLDFTLPFGPVTIYAVVRQRHAFRYGFQFVQSDFIDEVIRPTCAQLAMENRPVDLSSSEG
jgi:PilZ domain